MVYGFITKDCATTLKLLAVVCCFDSDGTNGLRLENISLMFLRSEIVSWKKSSQIDFDSLSLRNFMLYLPHSLAGEFCVWVNRKGTINDSGTESNLKTFEITVAVPL